MTQNKNAHPYPKISLEGRPVAAERQFQDGSAQVAEQGMAFSASPWRLAGRADKNEDAALPAMDIKWRDNTVSSPEEADCISLCRGMGVFAFGDLQIIATAGTRLAQKVGGLVQASGEIQLIRFREIEYTKNFIGRTHHLYPTIATEVMSIYTDGAIPMYTPYAAETSAGWRIPP